MHVKISSILLVIRKMQRGTIVYHHVLPNRMAMIRGEEKRGGERERNKKGKEKENKIMNGKLRNLC